jgi:hypothetical protein
MTGKETKNITASVLAKLRKLKRLKYEVEGAWS